MTVDGRPRETAGKRLWRVLKPEAQRMRTEPTAAENTLWHAIRGHRLGVRFRRQHAIDRFIVDFVCLPKKLVVEVDGEIHDEQIGRDQERDGVLTAAGYRVIRYTNEQVLQDTGRVVEDIRRHLDASSKSPSPPGEGCLTTKLAGFE